MVDARAETPESEPDESMLVDNDIDQSPRSDHDGPDAMRSVPSSPVLLADADAAPVLPSEGGAEIDAACRTGPGRLRAHASIPPMHPAVVLGKMADLPFRLASEFVGDIPNRYVVAPGVQADGIDTMEPRVGMKRAASQISRSQYEIYNFATKHNLSETATNELLMLVGNVGGLYHACCF
jgi:hypothetical protein